jgi:hypothetical protein
MSLSTRDFGAKVPADLYTEFRTLFPQYGATTWFIITALEAFLDQVRDEPLIQEGVSLSIKQMLLEHQEERNEA